MGISEKSLSFWPISSILKQGVPQFVEFLTNKARKVTSSQSIPERVLKLHDTVGNLRTEHDVPVMKATELLPKSAFSSMKQLKPALELLRD